MLQCQNYILADQIFTLLVGSPLSWLAVLKVSSILINFILLIFWIMSENYFQTHVCTTEFFGSLYRDSEFLPPSSRLSFLIGTLCKQASGYGSKGELWQELPSCMFQRPHHPLRPSSCHPNGWGSLWLLFNWRLGQTILHGNGSGISKPLGLGLVRWDDPEGWYGEGGGFRMGNTCVPVADSCWYMAKPIQYCKVKKIKKK